MGARGRTSSAAILVAGLDAVHRPDPPGSLDEDAAKEWRLVVSNLPAHWFAPENLTMLELRCKHAVWMQRTSELADKAFREGDFKAYNLLSRQVAAQARLLIQYDTAMRLTQQSTYDKSQRKGARAAKTIPWQDAVND